MNAYAAVVLLFQALLTSSQVHHYKRFCYVESWAKYRDAVEQFNPEDIGAGLCTHLSFAFATLDDSATQLKATDSSDDPSIYKRFNAIKRHHPHLKTLLSVGGWTMGSKLFTKLVSTDSNINAFAKNAITYLRDRGFDGLDVDWEFPADRGSPAGDKQRFTKLIQTLHGEFHNEAKQTGKAALLLTAALNPEPSRISTAYEPLKLAKSLDLINLMTYDMHGDWETPLTANHHSALYGTTKDPNQNIDYMANYWANLGVPKQKILVGLPFYARSFALNDTAVKQVGSAAYGPGKGEQYTHEDGTMAFFEVCKLLKNGAEHHLSANQSVPYLVDGERWAGYDDEKSLQQKVKYVVDHGYGGIMVWALDLDDFSGECGKKYPLMHAVKDAFNNLVG